MNVFKNKFFWIGVLVGVAVLYGYNYWQAKQEEEAAAAGK